MCCVLIVSFVQPRSLLDPAEAATDRLRSLRLSRNFSSFLAFVLARRLRGASSKRAYKLKVYQAPLSSFFILRFNFLKLQAVDFTTRRLGRSLSEIHQPFQPLHLERPATQSRQPSPFISSPHRSSELSEATEFIGSPSSIREELTHSCFDRSGFTQ